MPLQQQVIPLAISKGLDLKTDDKQSMFGSMLVLENAVFTDVLDLNKRFGFNTVASSIGAGNAIASYEGELVAFDGESVYSYSVNQDTFNNKGTKVAIDIQTSSIVQNSKQQNHSFSTFHPTAGLYAYAYVEGATASQLKGLNYSVVDSVTGQRLVNNTVLDVDGENAIVRYVGNYILIFWVNATSVLTPILKYVYINVTTPTIVSSPQTLVAQVGIGGFYAVTPNLNRLYVSYLNQSNTLSFLYIDSSLVASSIVTVSAVIPHNMWNFADSSNNIWTVYYGNGSQNLYYTIYNSSLASVLAPTVLVTFPSGQVPFTPSGIYDGTQGVFFYSQNSPAAASSSSANANTDYYLSKITASVSGTVGSPTILLRSAILISGPFIQNSNIYFAFIFSSPLQNTYFLADSNANIVAKFAPDVATSFAAIFGGFTIADINRIDANNLEFPYLNSHDLTSVNGGLVSLTGLSSIQFTFGEPIATSTLSTNLHITGGILSMYDGASVVEHSYNVFPEGLVSHFYITDGVLGQNTYQYEQTFEWTDNQGQIHRSAPSPALTLDLNPITSPASFSFTGNATSGSAGISAASSIAEAFIGAKIVGPGIPDDTTIDAITSSTSLSLSNNFTSNEVGATFTIFPQFIFTADTSQGSNIIVTGQMEYLQFLADWDSSTTTMNIPNTSGIIAYNGPVGVGFILSVDTGDFQANTAIATLSGHTATLGLNPLTTKNKTLVTAAQQFKCTQTNGSPNYTNVDATFLTRFIVVGQQLSGGAKVVSASGTTIVTDTTYVGTTTNNVIVHAFFRSSAKLQIGQVITDPSGLDLPAGVTITAINGNNVTISQPATASALAVDLLTTTVMSVYIDMPTLRLTAKTNAVLALYRTAGNGTVFYRVSSITAPTYNDKTVNYIEVQDNVSDVTIVGNELLYTTGGTVDNIAIPATSQLTQYRNRLYGITEENSLIVWYSQQILPGLPVEFSDLFTFVIEEEGGPVIAAGAMDDKIIFFKSDRVYYMAVNGPAPSGANNDITSPSLITTDTGCNNKKSVVTTPLGLMYQSPKGIYLLDRSLKDRYIGSAVEDFNNQTVTSAQLMEKFNQVRFTLQSGTELVYDYYVDQWYSFTGLSAVDSTEYNDYQAIISSAGLVRLEDPNFYTDDGAAIQMKLQTSWVSFNSVQGFQRIYEFLALSEWFSPHSLQFDIAYDFDPTIAQTTTIPVLTDPTLEQFRIFFNKQKTETVQITMTELQSATFGRGLSLSNFAFKVGAKKGPFKRPAAQSYG